MKELASRLSYRLVVLMSCFVLGTVAVGCGDDDDAPVDGGADGGAGTRADGGAGTRAGSGGAGGSGGTRAGSGGSDDDGGAGEAGMDAGN